MSDYFKETERRISQSPEGPRQVDDRRRTRTPLASPEEKTAVNAPSIPDSRDATKVSAVHSTH